MQIVYDLKKEEFVNGAIRYENYVPKPVSKERLAFDHVEILIEAIKRLREQIYYNDQAFCLVEKTFTLPELQRVYEAVLGKPLYKKSFRDMISAKVEETGSEKTSRFKGGRRSTEYTFRS